MQKGKNRYLLLKEAFVATILFTVVAYLISLIPFVYEFIRPIRQGYNDFDIYDLYYSRLEKEKSGVERNAKNEDIVIVQAADSRGQIARQIRAIKQLRPKVIGVDLSFQDSMDFNEDKALKDAMSGDSIIIGYTLIGENEDATKVREKFFSENEYLTKGGFINYSEDAEDNSVIRKFSPYHHFGTNDYIAFAVRVTEKYSPVRAKELLSRNKETEFINYSGNLESYLTYTAKDFEVLTETKQLEGLKNKIILLGYFAYPDDPTARSEDIFFSPMNKNHIGKGIADIYGVVLHANIISMILDGNKYIKDPPLWISFLISDFIVFGLCYFMLWRYKKYYHPYHALLIPIQIVIIILFVYLFIKLFDWFSIKVNFMPAILLIVVSVELFDFYKILAKWLSKKGYKTIFSNH